ncbi:hypothetical protein GJAV_G00191780, partial [Gymnothorax javanicus]
ALSVSAHCVLSARRRFKWEIHTTLRCDNSPELHFCTPLSSSMMKAGVCLRRDTETTLPELTEQHRIRQKEEELSGLESVHMAESETECAAPGLNTLEPECVTARSGVSDVHHTHTSLIKTETDLGSTHSGDLKTESRDSTELGYVTHLHPDQIKTETDDGGYLKSEQISDWQDIKCVLIKCDQVKCESSENLGIDLMKTVMSGVCNDRKDTIEGRVNPVLPNVNCKEEIKDFSTQNGNLNPCQFVKGKNGKRIIQENTKSINKPITCEIRSMTIEPLITASKKLPRALSVLQKKIVRKNECKIQVVTDKRKNKSVLSHGFRIHRGKKSYKCTHCGNCYPTLFQLKSHLRVCTGENSYKCSHCGKCFSTRSDLMRHCRVHTGEKPYRCTECEKRFYRQYCLNTHLRTHTGQKPYQCSYCGKCFSVKSYLNSHQRIHTGQKPYKCSQCGKCFSQLFHLIRHRRIHTGEKPYKCTECEKCFCTNSELSQHCRVHLSEKPFKCIQCGKCLTTKSSLRRHLGIHSK